MLNNHQQHLSTFRRSLDKAKELLRSGGDVVVNSGWGHGRAFLDSAGKCDKAPGLPNRENLHLFFSSFKDGREEQPWHGLASGGSKALLCEELLRLLNFFWPGPFLVRVRIPGTRQSLTLGCPTHPFSEELLSELGTFYWVPVNPDEEGMLAEKRDLPEPEGTKQLTLLWPEEEHHLAPTVIDARTRPWRLTEVGFISSEELSEHSQETFILSADRASPARALRTFVPQHRTVVLEATAEGTLAEAVAVLREKIPPDSSIRIYLDETTAHAHFPDDREVRVYGEIGDPERVRRRLQAMLERQRRILGKRVFLIAVPPLGSGAESLRADLEKVSDRWLVLRAGEELEVDEL